MEKKCYICDTIKDITEFYKNQTRCKCCTKQYAIENDSKIKSYKKQYRKDNLEFVKESNKDYYLKNKETIRNKHKEYYLENTEEVRRMQEEYRKNNREILTIKNRGYSMKYHNNKKSDPIYKLTKQTRSLIRSSFKYKNHYKKSPTQDILGCSFDELKFYLESKFESWMSWENYGKYNGNLNYGWDIDHIIPLSSATTEEEIYKLNHYTNLQPLCSYTNRHIKSYKVDYYPNT